MLHYEVTTSRVHSESVMKNLYVVSCRDECNATMCSKYQGVCLTQSSTNDKLYAYYDMRQQDDVDYTSELQNYNSGIHTMQIG